MVLLGVGFAAPLRGAEPIKEDEPEIKAEQLLKPEAFPDASFGMGVEAANDGAQAKVVTTGAEFVIDKQANTIECRQRIAAQRPVAVIALPPGTLEELKLSHTSSGAAIFTGGKNTVRVNGDSMLMIQPANDGDIVAKLQFTPDYHSGFHGNFNFFDPTGGISFFDHATSEMPSLDAAEDPVTIKWAWKGGNVFWAGVSPPKPFDWKKSIEQRVVFYGSSMDRYMYPSDLLLARWKSVTGANIFYLHGENLWEHWQMNLVPRDMDEYRRTMRTAHEMGMKTIVYASPKLFLKGTVIEHLAKPDVNDLPPGWHTGSNVSEYLKQATRIIKEFETDGLYFDEMYCSRKALATNYYLARSARDLVGPDGPLVFHSTEDVLSDRTNGEAFGRTHCPTIHAYFDATYKGEAVWDSWDPAYTRYILSSYNISNTIAVQIAADERYTLSPAKVDFILRHANARLFVPEQFYFTGEIDVFRDHYWPRLTDHLKTELEPTLLRRTGVFDQFRKAARTELTQAQGDLP